MEPLPITDSDVIYLSASEVARHAAREAADVIEAVVRDDIEWHRAHPYPAFRFHSAYHNSLPRWRWLARAWHRMRARRAWAMWKATAGATVALRTETERIAARAVLGPGVLEDATLRLEPPK